jgi:hypothetical protein
MDTAEFFRDKATQCRAMAAEVADHASIQRGLLALALELEARAVAVEAGRATDRAMASANGHKTNGGDSSE